MPAYQEVYIVWTNIYEILKDNDYCNIISIHETEDLALKAIKVFDPNFKESDILESDFSELGHCTKSGCFCTRMLFNKNIKKYYLLEIWKHGPLDNLYFLCPSIDDAITECVNFFKNKYGPEEITEKELEELPQELKNCLMEGHYPDVPIFVSGKDYFYECMLKKISIKKYLK